MNLSPLALAAGHTLTWFETIGSTNAYALSLSVTEGAHWIVAGRQSAGRGRQGRHWSSPPGNLYATLLLVDPCEPRHAAKLGFVAGVALIEAIGAVAPRLVGLSLKWPNDVLLAGAKLAGILLEGQTTAAATGRPCFSVAIGMGVNLAFHPDDAPYPTTSLAAAGHPLSPAEILPRLADSVVHRLARFDRGAGFAAVREEWLSRAHGIGGPITVRLPNDSFEGAFTGIDADGRLMVARSDAARPGLQFVDAGDIYFPGISALGARQSEQTIQPKEQNGLE